MKTLVLTLDLIGTFVFALSGATAGARRRLDIFGVLVLSFVAANSGGIVRDVLIGATPPAAISDWRYLAVSMLAGVAIFFWYPVIKRMENAVLLSNVPAVFRSDIYAVAALAGASVVVIGDALQLPTTPTACAGAALCFGLRLAAIRYGWHLPTARTPDADQNDGAGNQER